MIMALTGRAGVTNRTDHSSSYCQVSIITPAYKAVATLPGTVRSVLSQSYPHWEMIIVSDDGIDYELVLRREGLTDGRLRFLTSGRTQAGPNVSRNIALAEAQGDLIAPLDADDIYYPDRLEKLVPAALEYGMSGDNGNVVDALTNEVLGTIFLPSYGMQWLTLEDFMAIHTPQIFLFRRDIIPLPWDENIDLGADTLFNMRGVERVEKVPVFTQVLHEYFVRPGSICHAPDSHIRAEKAYSKTLEKLAENGLGFESQAGLQTVHALLKNKQRLNRQYVERLREGESQNFAEFVARNRLSLLLEDLRLQEVPL